MSKILRPRNLFLLAIILAMVPSLAASSSYSSEKMVDTRCDVQQEAQDGSGEISIQVSKEMVKFNGSPVESVNCSNIEAYTFQGSGDYREYFLELSPPATHVAGFFLPLTVIVSLGAGLSRRDYFELKEVLKIFGTSVTVIGLSILGVVLLMNSFRSDFIEILAVILMVGAPFFPSAVNYYRQKKADVDERKVGALATFGFTAMIYWGLVIYYLTNLPVAIA